MKNRAILTIGCPGSGKTTFASGLQHTVLLSLDDFRTALFGSKKKYWQQVAPADEPEDFNHPMRKLVRTVYTNALHCTCEQHFDVVLPNTHLFPDNFKEHVEILQSYDYEIKYHLFNVPIEVLLMRNSARFAEKPDDWCSPKYVQRCHKALNAPDAWWRSLPSSQLVIHSNGE